MERASEEETGDVGTVVFVGYASEHGSTKGAAERIAARIELDSADVIVGPMVDHVATDATLIDRYDAVVLGSAVHNGTWLPEAHAFIQATGDTLADKPTWLFSVCSIGDSSSFFSDRVGRFLANRRNDSEELDRWRTAFDPVDHRYFSGAIEPDHWPRLGKVVLRLLGGSYGDHRDWNDIETWADSISAAIESGSVFEPADDSTEQYHPRHQRE